MAMTVSVSLSPTSISSGGETEVSVQVSNSAGAAIRVIELRHTIQALQRTSMAMAGCSVEVPASGSTTFKYKVQAFNDNQSISVRAYSDDGQCVSGSASLTIS